MSGNALLLSLKPRFADAIFDGTKTVELRRVRPRVKAGDLVVVYVTSPRCQIEGAFRVERVLEASPTALWRVVTHRSGTTKDEFFGYFDGKSRGFGIVVRERWRLAAPLKLGRMRTKKLRPPQGYQYLTHGVAQALTLRPSGQRARLRRG